MLPRLHVRLKWTYSPQIDLTFRYSFHKFLNYGQLCPDLNVNIENKTKIILGLLL